MLPTTMLPAIRLIYIQLLVIITVTVSLIDSKPIEVTGKNIKYYQLTPNEGSGSYNFDYGTNDGSERSERGYIKMEPGSVKPLLVITGTFKYPDPEGGFYEVSYIADEQGYRIVPKTELNEIASQSEQTLPTDLQIKEILPQLKPTKLPSPPPILELQPPSLKTRSSSEQPVVLESKKINLIIKPIGIENKAIECEPGKCSGARQSKIFQIKSLKFTG